MGKNGDYAGDLYSAFRRQNPAVNRKVLIQGMYERVLTEYACNRFKWEGLPDTIDPRFLELTLFHKGLCVFYMSARYERFMALPAAQWGAVNMYDNPTRFTVVGNQMVREDIPANACVPIWANYLRCPDWDIVTIYSTKLAEIDRTIEVNLQHMRKPFVLVANENNKQSIMNAYRQVQEGQPVIVTTSALGADLDDKMTALDTRVDFRIVSELLMDKAKIWSECMTLLGINNANQDKKERLVAAEVSANDSQVEMSRAVALTERQRACEAINEMYGLNVTCEWSDIGELAMPATPGEGMGMPMTTGVGAPTESESDDGDV